MSKEGAHRTCRQHYFDRTPKLTCCLSRAEASTIAAELVKASVEGRLKRKRTYEFEKEKMHWDLDRLWKEAKKIFVKEGAAKGTSTHSFIYEPRFQEFEVTKLEVEGALPEQLKEIAKLDGFNLLVRELDGPKFGIVLEYFHPVDDVVQARLASGTFE